MKTAAILAFLAIATSPLPGQTLQNRPGKSAAATSLQRKLDKIRATSQRPPVAPVTTVLPENEINAWFASSYAALPKGIRTLHLAGANGQVTADAQVDFDEITGGAAASNPLLGLFSGIHKVQVVATGNCVNGQATLHAQTVTLDGVEIPDMVLRFFLQKFVQNKYPNLGIDSRFTPGYRIDSAQVGDHVLSVVQK